MCDSMPVLEREDRIGRDLGTIQQIAAMACDDQLRVDRSLVQNVSQDFDGVGVEGEFRLLDSDEAWL